MSKKAVIFPGQGSQSVGMGKEVCEGSLRAKTVFHAADEILGFELSKVCFEGPEEELQRTDIQQPAIFATSVAIWEALLESGLPDDFVDATAGLSLGEYTALHVAGAIGFEDALKLVAERGRLMQEAAVASPSSMVSVIGASEDDVVALCEKAAQGEILAPANYNCPGQIVISGSVAACERAVELASEFHGKAIPLKVAGAFHSAFMSPAAEKLAAMLGRTPISRPRIPVLANVNAQEHLDADSIRDALSMQLTQPVLWSKSMAFMIEVGYEVFLEVGPGRVLTGLMRKIDRKQRIINVSKASQLEAVFSELTAE